MKQFQFDIAIIGGLGHVGLPLGIAFANKNQKVLLLDVNLDYSKKVMDGVMPFIEYGAEDRLQKALKDKLISISNEPSKVSLAEHIIICIGTPIDEYLNPKIQKFLNVISSYSKYIISDQNIIIRSSVYPGTCDQVNNLLPENINISYCPERIVQGYALKELSNLPQIIGGFSKEAESRSAELFRLITKQIIFSSVKQAELVKLFSNTWRYLQFAATNQFYMICSELEEDYQEVRDIMMNGYSRMEGFPSAGFSAGPCLLKDTMQLANISNNAHYLCQAAMHINEGMPAFIVRDLAKKHSLKDITVGILGMAFKANIDDTRDSLSYKLKKQLAFAGAKVLCTDEYAKDIELLPLDKVISESKIIIIASPHDAYKEIKIPKDKIIVDIWNIITHNE